jgi:NADPH-dependent curcumin reductase CurA
MKQGGRIICCGMISGYNATEPPAAPRNLFLIVGRRLRLQGFIVGDHWHYHEEFTREIAPRVRSGEIPYEETIVEGLESAPRAFAGLFRGENLGKMVVRVVVGA